MNNNNKKKLFSSSSVSALKVCQLHIWDYWYFSQQSWFQLVRHPAQHFACGEKKVKLLSCVQLFVTLWTIAYQAPLSMGLSRQEYWSGLPFPSPGDLPDPGIELMCPALQADALLSEPPRKWQCGSHGNIYLQSSGVSGYEEKASWGWAGILQVVAWLNLQY